MFGSNGAFKDSRLREPIFPPKRLPAPSGKSVSVHEVKRPIWAKLLQISRGG